VIFLNAKGVEEKGNLPRGGHRGLCLFVGFSNRHPGEEEWYEWLSGGPQGNG